MKYYAKFNLTSGADIDIDVKHFMGDVKGVNELDEETAFFVIQSEIINLLNDEYDFMWFNDVQIKKSNIAFIQSCVSYES